MTYFPETVVAALVYGSLALTTAGVLTLLALLWRDMRDGRLW